MEMPHAPVPGTEARLLALEVLIASLASIAPREALAHAVGVREIGLALPPDLDTAEFREALWRLLGGALSAPPGPG